MATPLFERDGDRLTPTHLTVGPWDPGHCHGGAPAALVAHLVESTPTLVDMATVRLTIELLRPVTLIPLTWSVHVLREGRRVQLLELTLEGEQGPVLRCRALKIRTTDLELPAGVEPDEPAPDPGPEGLPRYTGGDEWPSGFHEALDLRVPGGHINQRGATTAWFRLLAPVLDDVPVSPLSRAAAAADFGNGLSSPLPMGPYVFVNPDVTLDLHREPESEWIAVRASTDIGRRGAGLSTSRLYDRHGPVGTALQSLYVDRAP